MFLPLPPKKTQKTQCLFQYSACNIKNRLMETFYRMQLTQLTLFWIWQIKNSNLIRLKLSFKEPTKICLLRYNVFLLYNCSTIFMLWHYIQHFLSWLNINYSFLYKSFDIILCIWFIGTIVANTTNIFMRSVESEKLNLDLKSY